MGANPFRTLPSVNEILDAPAAQGLMADHAREQIISAVRAELDALRQRIVAGESVDGLAEPTAVAARVVQRLRRELRPKLRSVINATGIILHTNLGRAPVAEEAARAAYERGPRGLSPTWNSTSKPASGSSRPLAVREWICRLTGAESATAVNNNAAATVLVLRALCQGKEVVVSAWATH